MRSIVRNEGLLALQGGLLMSMQREFFKCGLRIGLYAPLMAVTRGTDAKGAAPTQVKLAVAAACGAISAIVCNPLDLSKTRMQERGGTLRDTVRQIYAEGVSWGFGAARRSRWCVR